MVKYLARCVTFFFLIASPATGQPTTAKLVLPAGYVSVGDALGGTFIVAKPLKDKYDELRSRTRTLQAQIDDRAIDEEQARKELEKLEQDLALALAAIETSKRQVDVAHVDTKEVVSRFELGKERLLLIRADRVKVVGWEKPHVECVLEKIVLSVDGEQVEEHMAAIQVKHRHGVAPDDAGYTDEQYIERMKGDQPELTPLQNELVQQIIRFYRAFAPIRGKEIDVLEIVGLTGQQGNRQLTLEVQGAAGKSLSSEWRRHAQFTVFVPKCNWLAIRGGRLGTDVESLDASLAIIGDNDLDYAAVSRISNVSGDVLAQEIALHHVEKVEGNVDVRQTAYQENASTHYSGQQRTMFAGPNRPYRYENIAGDVRLLFTRADVTVDNVGGVVNVRNDFGNTNIMATHPLAEGAHRIVSQSGNIDVRVPKLSGAKISTLAMTECGSVQLVNVDREIDSKNITTSTEPGPIRRSWKGFCSKEIQFFFLNRRISAAFTEGERSPGLDIVTRAGRIRLEHTN